jgi:membrane-bound lytic murein transglycosylase F
MGVTNRLDPKQSIVGGSRYLARLYQKIDPGIAEPDRTLMALAAYNLGLGHLEDARKLTAEIGRNPHAWSDVRATLPLLRLKKYYRRLTHGYARGNEAVRYVDRIRTYHKVLVRWEEEQREADTAKTAPVNTATTDLKPPL